MLSKYIIHGPANSYYSLNEAIRSLCFQNTDTLDICMKTLDADFLLNDSSMNLSYTRQKEMHIVTVSNFLEMKINSVILFIQIFSVLME